MGKKSKRYLRTEGRTYRVTLDKFLADKKLARKSIAKDGSCLFRAVSEQVYNSQGHHQEVRLKCVEYIGSHEDDFKEFITIPLDEYLSRLSRELWGGELELVALSRLYNRSIVVYNEVNKAVQEQVFLSTQDEERGCTTENVEDLENRILLAYSGGNHYDSVYSTQFMEDVSFCQGLVYSCLVEKVFKKTVPSHCEKKLKNMPEWDAGFLAKLDREGTSSTMQPKDPAVHGLYQKFQYQEIMAMSWTQYHNAALHVHRYEKHSIEQRDRSMAASIQFSIGNKCDFHVDGRRMSGEIVGLNVRPGFHLVQPYQAKKQERWEIPIKDITLMSKRPREEYRTPAAASHAWQQKDKSGSTPASSSTKVSTPASSSTKVSTPASSSTKVSTPASSSTKVSTPASSSTKVPVSTAQSLLGPVPESGKSPSVPFGSMKKGKIGSSVQSGSKVGGPLQQMERPQKQDGQKRRDGRTQGGGHVESTAGQGRNVKTKPAKPDQPSATSSSTAPPAPPVSTSSGNSSKATQYSSVVKKTAGGPSGSLTSECDESSGEEGEAEATGTTSPQQQQQQQVTGKYVGRKLLQQDVKSGKPSSASHDKQPVVKPSLPAGNTTGSVVHEKSSQFVAHPYQAPSSSTQLNTPGSHEALSLKRHVDSPYLERRLPQSSSSQPEDAWPVIDEDHNKEIPLATCTDIPSPEKTILYAAAMSNQIKSAPPPSTSSSAAHFPYSSTPGVEKSHFASPAFTSPQQMPRVTQHNVTSPPLNVPQNFFMPMPQQPTSLALPGLMRLSLNANLLKTMSANLPYAGARVATTPSNQHSLFQANQLPSMPPLQPQAAGYAAGRTYPGVHVTTGGGGGGGEVYSSSAAVPKASSTPQVGYGNSRPARNMVVTSALPYSSTTSLPYTTQAASMTMRNMLGIDNIHPAGPALYSTGQHVRTTGDQSTQTPPAAKCCSRAVQVGVEMAEEGVQTQGPECQDTPSQTSGCFVPVESLAPPEDVQMNSLADRLSFAVQYSLQCLSAFSQHNADQSSQHSEDLSSTQTLESSLRELLLNNQIELLADQAARVNSLSMSQQEFLKSMTGVPREWSPRAESALVSAGGAGESVTDPVRNESTTPQQEQIRSPPPLPLNLPPNFPPFLFPPRPGPPHFMMPGNMGPPMMYPIMAPMPVPTPMGYMPFIHPQMMPRPPPMPPQGSGGEPSAEDQEPGVYGTPDSAHQDSSVQDQVQGAGDSMNSDPQQQQQQQEPLPPHPTPQVQSSEMVASVYPIPPLVMAQSDTPQQQLPSEQPGQHTADEKEMDVSHQDPVQDTGHTAPTEPVVTPIAPVVEVEVSAVEEPLPSSVHNNPQPVTQVETRQPKAHKTSTKRHSSQRKSSSGDPGLPCRPSPQPQAPQQAQSRRYSHNARAKNEGDARRSNSKPGHYRGYNKRGEQGEEWGANGGSGEAKSSTKRSSRNSYKSHRKQQPVSNHAGSNTVTGNSPKSEQDPSRNFGRLRSTSSSTAGGGVQDTIDFRWCVPSPCSTSPGLIHPSHTIANPTPAAPGDKTQADEASEWPDFSELYDTGVPNCVARETNPLRFKAVDGEEEGEGELWNTHPVKGGPQDLDAESLEDPFLLPLPLPSVEVYGAGMGDYPLTISPTQSQSYYSINNRQCCNPQVTDRTHRH